MSGRRDGIACARILTICLATGAPLAGHAADTVKAPPPAPATVKSAGTEEVIVTAQRRSQRINSVPATITAVTGKQLRQAGAFTTADLQALNTNVVIQGAYGNNASTTNVTIRGIGLADFNDNNAGPAGIYIDEVYQVSPLMTAFGLLDQDRVEVLKGPQGTLYGRNTTAGAVSFYSKSPGPRWQGDAQLNVEEYNRVNLQAGVGGPITDTLGIRIAITSDNGGGYQYNRVRKDTENNRDYRAGRVVLDWKPNDDLAVRTTLSVGQDRSQLGHYLSGSLLDPSTGAFCAAALAGRLFNNGCVDALGYSPGTGDRSVGDYNVSPTSHYNTWAATTRAIYTLGAVTLTSVTGYSGVSGYRRDESDASPNRLLETNYDTRVQQVSQELRAAFRAGPTDWIVGGYWGQDTIAANNDYVLYQDAGPPNASAYNSRFRQDTTALAAFGHVIWTVLPGLKAQAGLRYTNEEKGFATRTVFGDSLADIAAGRGDVIVDLPAQAASFNVPVNRRFTRLTWTTGLSYDITPTQLAYVTVANSFKSGGYNGGLLFDPRQALPYNPESITAYEVGTKLGLLDRRLQLNASAFYYDYTDLQVFQVVPVPGSLPLQILSNAPSAEVYGIEADATWDISRGFAAQFGIGQTTATYTKAAINGIDRRGAQFPNTPRLMLNASLRYTAELDDTHVLTANLRARYQNSQILDYLIVDTTAGSRALALSQSGYWIVDPRIAVGPKDGRWEFSLYVKNLFDERPFTNMLVLQDFGFAELTALPPRRFGAGFAYRF